MSRVALASEGRLSAGLVAAAVAVAACGGSNALAFAAAAGLACWALAGVAGWRNLRSLVVRRELPAEIFAATDAPGTLVIANPGRWAASAVAVHDGPAQARVDTVGPGVERRAPVAWRFPTRGDGALDTIVLSSRFPFGWLEWTREIPVPTPILVFPRPVPGPVHGRPGPGVGEPSGAGRGTGDWHGIRPWREGDRERDLHWPSTARTGEWMVVERAALAATAVEIALDVEIPFERAVSAATAAVLAAPGPVGLALGERRYPARVGAVWKRVLLEALARVEPW